MLRHLTDGTARADRNSRTSIYRSGGSFEQQETAASSTACGERRGRDPDAQKLKKIIKRL